HTQVSLCFRPTPVRYGLSLPLYSSLLLNPVASVPSPLSLHDALPISLIPGIDRSSRIRSTSESRSSSPVRSSNDPASLIVAELRSEEHTSELQSRENLVCRLLLVKKM